MARHGPITYTTGQTVRAMRFNRTLQVRDVIANTWDNWADLDIDDYDTACTELGLSGEYYFDDPTGVTDADGGYWLAYAGAVTLANVRLAIWNNEIEVKDGNLKYISDDGTAADNLEAMLDGTGGVALSTNNVATSANQTTILARLGAWTGSGLNTVLGGIRALAAKAAGLTPTDLSTGTTFDNTTDALEAVRDRGDAAWTTGGGGGGSETVAHTDTAQAGAASTITLATGASATTDIYKGNQIRVQSGTGAGQTRVITGYVGSTKVATVDRAWTTNPDNTSVYSVLYIEGPKLDASLQVTGAALLTITPVQVNAANPRYSTRNLATVAQGSAPTDILTVTDGTGTAINLSGKSLRLVVASVTEGDDEESILDDTLAAKYEYETGGSGLTVGGASSNQVTIQHTAANTATVGEFRYWLWNTTDNIVLVKGSLTVEPAAADYP
jgi:hypothetical protein